MIEQPLNKQTVPNPLPSPWKPGSGFIVQGNKEGPGEHLPSQAQNVRAVGKGTSAASVVAS